MNPSHGRRDSGGRRATRLRQAERRRLILSKARALFTRLGYLHTTTEKIAAAVEVTEPILYRHFPSKKALFLAVLAEAGLGALDRWRQAVRQVADPRRGLQAVLESYLVKGPEGCPDIGLLHRTLLEVDDPDIAAALRHFYLEAERFLAGLVAQGQENGDFRADLDPRVAAWELIQSVLAYTLTYPLRIPLYGESEYAARALDCLLEGLASRQEPPSEETDRPREPDTIDPPLPTREPVPVR